jgi:hypothetical protein
MKNYLLFIFFNIQIAFGVAQPRFNVVKYYKYINEAELCIVNDDLVLALKKYSNAFTNIERVFIKDSYNAFICAFRSHQYQLADEYLKMSLNAGLKLKFLSNNSSLSDVLESDEWKKLELKYRNYKVEYDTILYNKLLNVHNADQAVRNYCYLYGKENYSYSTSCIDTVRKVDKNNLDSVIFFISTYGFPNELLSGLEVPFGKVHYYFTFLHNTSWNNISFLPILKSAVIEGKLSPSIYFDLTTRAFSLNKENGDYDFGLELGFQVKNLDSTTTMVLTIGENEYDINTKRNEVYLESLHDLRKKIIFNYRRSDYSLVSKGLIPLLNFDESSKTEFLNRIKKDFPNSQYFTY